jgi:hypothetical protein
MVMDWMNRAIIVMSSSATSLKHRISREQVGNSLYRSEGQAEVVFFRLSCSGMLAHRQVLSPRLV